MKVKVSNLIFLLVVVSCHSNVESGSVVNMKTRINYEESCRHLQNGYLDAGAIPPMPKHIPQYDDPEPLGVNFFRTLVKGELNNLTLQRTFFGRSEIRDAQFQNTDLTESNLSWNDFIDVDFTDGILTKSDLRASLFNRVKFIRTDLRGADLRRSTFENCKFDNAQMSGTILTRKQGKKMSLSKTQSQEILWSDDEGPEPNGG